MEKARRRRRRRTASRHCLFHVPQPHVSQSPTDLSNHRCVRRLPRIRHRPSSSTTNNVAAGSCRRGRHAAPSIPFYVSAKSRKFFTILVLVAAAALHSSIVAAFRPSIDVAAFESVNPRAWVGGSINHILPPGGSSASCSSTHPCRMWRTSCATTAAVVRGLPSCGGPRGVPPRCRATTRGIMESTRDSSDAATNDEAREEASRRMGASPIEIEGASPRLQFTYYLGVGSNMGDRFGNIQRAVRLLENPSLMDDDESNNFSSPLVETLRVTRTSFLYETPPMYLSNQPHFLNAAIRVEGTVPKAMVAGDDDGHDKVGEAATHDLLRHIKRVERHLGRALQNSPMYVRNGPRPIDLDILMGEYSHYEYDDDGNHGSNNYRNETNRPVVLHSDNLTVPHPRIAERRFVLVPLGDVAGRREHHHHHHRHPTTGATIEQMLRDVPAPHTANVAEETRVLPMPRERFLHLNRTIIMGILNVTPDSFSDGDPNRPSSAAEATRQALTMVRDGADIVDVGGESTRPGASPVSVEEELSRVIPVIRQIRSKEPNIPISIDTRNARVAREAVLAGADVVNDVSAGRHDPDMFPTVADLGVPIVLMHMRGTPETMQNLASYEEDRGGVVAEVTREMEERCRAAEDAGIHRWLQIVDPGIGFAKKLPHNLQLLTSLEQLRSATGNVPVLLGTSRKGFIGALTGVAKPSDRDPGSIASVVAALCLDPTPNACNIIRVHNVADCKQAVQVMDALRNGRLDQI